MEWKPIESAPKDHKILLWIPGIGCSVGKWDVDQYTKRPRPYWTAEFCANRIQRARSNQPTHWMEIPAMVTP